MSGSGNARGQPLVALLAVLAGWAGGRVATWETPQLSDDTSVVQREPLSHATSAPGFLVDERVGPQSLPGTIPTSYQVPYQPIGAPGHLADLQGYSPYPIAVPAGGPYRSVPHIRPVPNWFAFQPAAMRDTPGTGSGSSARFFLPASARFALFNEIVREQAPRFFAPEIPGTAGHSEGGGRQLDPQAPPARARRWSMDAWALFRQDGAGPLSPGVLPATYGASQSGSVLRYRLALSSRHRPAAYLRTTSALGGLRDNAIALGLAARPLPSVPVVAAVEGRLVDQSGSRNVRPAAFAYTELAPIMLPARLQAEAYIQAGYVGGGFATPFVDGLLRVDRHLLRIGMAEARLGGGLWGGAQRGAARIDTGPSASIVMPLGRGVFGRAAVDWRFRIAGDALPGSGPALTLSAGF